MPARIAQTSDPSETEALGAELAAALIPGDVVLVRGELGAGKTTLVRGAARALGVTDPVTSPTFGIGHSYRARGTTVSHLDLYRLAGLRDEEPDLLADYFGPDRIAFVEWPHEGAAELKGARVVVTIEHAGADTRRVAVSEAPLLEEVDTATQTPGDARAFTLAPGSGGARVIVLAFDTATPATVVGLLSADGGVREARDDPRPRERPGHSTRLLPLAAELLAEAGLGWRDVDRIAVGVGPGTFTGLRVGIATAHGLARSSHAELVGVSSLRALALGADREAPVLAAIDARRGEVFLAGYQGKMELFSPRALKPAAVPGFLLGHGAAFTGEDKLAVGDGAALYRGAFEEAGVRVPADGSSLHHVAATALCELGALARAGGDPVLPDYLRRPDAAIALEKAAR